MECNLGLDGDQSAVKFCVSFVGSSGEEDPEEEETSEEESEPPESGLSLFLELFPFFGRHTVEDVLVLLVRVSSLLRFTAHFGPSFPEDAC